MPQDKRNIYKIAREARGLTQEAAAEKLGISDSSIRAYETGQRVPPNEVVELMVICYDAQHLAYQHLRETNAMYGSIVPEVPERRLSEAIMALLDLIYAFVEGHRDRDLMHIGKDSIIDETERESFDSIVADLGQIVEAALAVRYAREGGTI